MSEVVQFALGGRDGHEILAHVLFQLVEVAAVNHELHCMGRVVTFVKFQQLRTHVDLSAVLFRYVQT